MKVISVIEDKDINKKDPQASWIMGVQSKTASQNAVLPEKTFECSIDYSSSQVHPDSEKWLYVRP